MNRLDRDSCGRQPWARRLRTPIGRLRAFGFVEGVSYLLLLGGAMPLKYFAGMPTAVTVVGWAHGLLFILLCAALACVQIGLRWPMRRAAVVFVAALLPFGPFVIDRWLERQDEDIQAPEHDRAPAAKRRL